MATSSTNPHNSAIAAQYRVHDLSSIVLSFPCVGLPRDTPIIMRDVMPIVKFPTPWRDEERGRGSQNSSCHAYESKHRWSTMLFMVACSLGMAILSMRLHAYLDKVVLVHEDAHRNQ